MMSHARYQTLSCACFHGKYDKLAAAHYAEFIPFSAETTGGLGAGARKIIDIIVRASKDRRSLIPSSQVRKQVRWAIAVAIQRGNAMTMRAGWIRAVGTAAACA